MKIGFWVLHFKMFLGKKIRGTYPYLPPEFKCSLGPEERFISFNANWHWKDNTFTLCESKLAYLFPLYICIYISNYFLNILHVFPLFSHDFPMMIIPWFSIYAIDYSVETFIEIVRGFPVTSEASCILSAIVGSSEVKEVSRYYVDWSEHGNIFLKGCIFHRENYEKTIIIYRYYYIYINIIEFNYYNILEYHKIISCGFRIFRDSRHPIRQSCLDVHTHFVYSLGNLDLGKTRIIYVNLCHFIQYVYIYTHTYIYFSQGIQD